MKLLRISVGVFFVFQLAGCTTASERKCDRPERYAECVKRNEAARVRLTPPIERRQQQVVPLQHPSAPVAQQPVMPPPPATIATCDVGGCWNSGGGRYSGGAGNTYLDSNGRPCQRNGAFMQCF